MPNPDPSARTMATSNKIAPAMPAAKGGALRRMIGTLAAAATALSLIATTTPARADSNDDMLKALIALGAVGIIAHEIDRKKDRERARDRQDNWHEDWRRDDRRHDNWRPGDDRRPPQHPSRETRIPSVCAIQIDGGRGRDGTVYSERCLRREGVEARLPRDCGFEMRARGRSDRMYSEQCLRQAGFRIGGRR